jgi:hypothetical protein
MKMLEVQDKTPCWRWFWEMLWSGFPLGRVNTGLYGYGKRRF